MTTEKNPETHIWNYVVVFLDLLGQKELLAEFPKLVPNGGLTPELERNIKNTYGAMFALRKSIKSCVEDYENHKVDPKLLEGLTDTQKDLFERITSPPKIYLQYMGDAIVLYSKLINEHGDLNLRSISTMLGDCALVMLRQFERANPIRGAVEIGAAMDWEEFGIYGSALHSAYSLESSVAKYTRVLIGDELLRYLQLWEKEKGINDLTLVNKKIARRCLSLICKDIDGRAILDFLSPDLPTFFGHSPDDAQFNKLRKSVEEGLSFVTNEYNRFVKKKNSELAFRYALLREYYMSRMLGRDERT